ncbi:hypothetical protein C8J56DRAFT_1139518, partial [Mycena floridula]
TNPLLFSLRCRSSEFTTRPYESLLVLRLAPLSKMRYSSVAIACVVLGASSVLAGPKDYDVYTVEREPSYAASRTSYASSQSGYSLASSSRGSSADAMRQYQQSQSGSSNTGSRAQSTGGGTWGSSSRAPSTASSRAPSTASSRTPSTASSRAPSTGGGTWGSSSRAPSTAGSRAPSSRASSAAGSRAGSRASGSQASSSSYAESVVPSDSISNAGDEDIDDYEYDDAPEAPAKAPSKFAGRNWDLCGKLKGAKDRYQCRKCACYSDHGKTTLKFVKGCLADAKNRLNARKKEKKAKVQIAKIQANVDRARRIAGHRPLRPPIVGRSLERRGAVDPQNVSPALKAALAAAAAPLASRDLDQLASLVARRYEHLQELTRRHFDQDLELFARSNFYLNELD